MPLSSQPPIPSSWDTQCPPRFSDKCQSGCLSGHWSIVGLTTSLPAISAPLHHLLLSGKPLESALLSSQQCIAPKETVQCYKVVQELSGRFPLDLPHPCAVPWGADTEQGKESSSLWAQLPSNECVTEGRSHLTPAPVGLHFVTCKIQGYIENNEASGCSKCRGYC